ncbi:MAG: hypothetical protein ABGY15_11425, partial [bacterium]
MGLVFLTRSSDESRGARIQPSATVLRTSGFIQGLFQGYSGLFRDIQGSSGFVTEHEKRVGSSQQTSPLRVTDRPKRLATTYEPDFRPNSPILRATRRIPQWPRKSLARTVHRPDRATVPF